MKHHGHVGITSEGKLDLKNIPLPWKELFKKAGIRKKDIKNNSDAVMMVLVEYGFIPRSMLPKSMQNNIQNNQQNAATNRSNNSNSNSGSSSGSSSGGKRTGRLLFDFEAMEEGELNAKQGDIVELHNRQEDFWLVKFKNAMGFIQSDYIEELLPLPVFWIEITTDNGEVYYHNENTGETSWDRPIPISKKSTSTNKTNKKTSRDEKSNNKKAAVSSSSPSLPFTSSASLPSLPPTSTTTKSADASSRKKVAKSSNQPPAIASTSKPKTTEIKKTNKGIKETESKIKNKKWKKVVTKGEPTQSTRKASSGSIKIFLKPTQSTQPTQPSKPISTSKVTQRNQLMNSIQKSKPKLQPNFLSDIQKGTTLKQPTTTTPTKMEMWNNGRATTTIKTKPSATTKTVPNNSFLSQIQQGKKLNSNQTSKTTKATNHSTSSKPPPKMDFLSQIQQGSKLKKMTPPKRIKADPVKVGGRMDLFAQIKLGSAGLKKIDPEKIKAKQAAIPKTGGGGIMDALRMAVNKNRSAIAGADDDEDDDEDSDYWSD